MDEELVMRSVYLRPTEDSLLRQLAHDLKVTKSDLIRSAVSVKLRDWLESNSDALVLHDLTFGRRESAADRAARIAIETETLSPALAKPRARTEKAPTRSVAGSGKTAKTMQRRHLTTVES